MIGHRGSGKMIEVLVQPLDPEDKHVEAEWRRLEILCTSSFYTSWDWVGTLLATLPAKNSLSLLRLPKVRRQSVWPILAGSAHCAICSCGRSGFS